MQDLDLSVILGVEDVCVVVAIGVLPQAGAYFLSEAVTAFTHVGWGSPDEEGSPVREVDHGTSLH